jgi:hypothetical protein
MKLNRNLVWALFGGLLSFGLILGAVVSHAAKEKGKAKEEQKVSSYAPVVITQCRK